MDCLARARNDEVGGSGRGGGGGTVPATPPSRDVFLLLFVYKKKTLAFLIYPSKGSRIAMVSSRSGEVDSTVTGASTSSSIRRTYFTAAAGSAPQERAP